MPFSFLFRLQIVFLLHMIRKALQHTSFITYLLVIHILLRAFLISIATLGNDEVYYSLYAHHLAWSYFDHPPMVGWLIWLTTFGNTFPSDVLIRLGPLILGTANLYFLFLIGKRISSLLTGNIAALLGATSFYVAIISGTFILPDTPQSTFWLLSILMFIQYIQKNKAYCLFLFGITTGLALLSKYHAVYLWAGALLYFLCQDRKAFTKIQLYLALSTSFLLFLPVILWNLNSPFSGINYHESRVGNTNWMPTFKHFFPEFFGQLFYNNPFNVILIFLAVLGVIKMKKRLSSSLSFLLFTSFPLLVTTLFMSMYNQTLPHWSGPAYFGLILFAAWFWSEKENISKPFFKYFLNGSIFVFSLVIAGACLQILTGWPLGKANGSTERLGKDDLTIDLAQWNRIGKTLETAIPENAVIITHNWFPAAHLTHYFGNKNNVKVYVAGSDNEKHQFLEYNEKQGAIPTDVRKFYVTTSHYYRAPSDYLYTVFENASPRQTIPIYQLGRPKVNVFIWELSSQEAILP